MTQEDLIFKKHYDYYKNIGIETIKQQAGQVEQVSSDYQGRVLYELLQNAFDKADKNILVKVVGNSLYVANDGTEFTYVADFDYKNGTSKRGDFQSLCSISTSTKDINTSIGNKGVGFKSVFSIAEHGFVNVFTQGKILCADPINEPISFRIYDSLKDAHNIPLGFDSEIENNIKEKIVQVQKENKDRGIPGYYFPLHITKEDEYILELFGGGYVTIIEIPFSEEQREHIKKLILEVKDIHFQFIQLKIEKNLIVNFEFEGIEPLVFKKEIKELNKDRHLIHASLGSKLFDIASKAGIKIDNPKIAIRIRNDNKSGLIYNYLPTKVPSPFKYFDFHADFHTTIDRKDFNTDGTIGEYNKALLRASLELYFCYLNSYLEEIDRLSMNLIYINQIEFNQSDIEFDWKWIDFDRNDKFHLYFGIVQDILGINDRNLNNSARFFTAIAKKYFSSARKSADHKLFFVNILKFINHYSTNSNKYSGWISDHIRLISEGILKKKVQIIPIAGELGRAIENEMIYRKPEDSPIKIPQFIGITLTDFIIENPEFRGFLRIKEFTQYNEILKNYRQVSMNGEVNNEFITETQQKELLLSLTQMIGEKEFDSTQRYVDYINRKQNVNTVKNLADFSVSTLFLKTINKSNEDKPLYKPAQMCYRSELDNEFIAGINNNVLHYIGVSFECENNSRFLYIDKALYSEQLRNGLDYIPSLWRRSGSEDDLIYEKVLNNMAVIYNGTATHPALINEDYTFFAKIRNVNKNEEVKNLLVSQYERFPKTFTEILKIHISETINTSFIKKDEIVKFYQRVFHDFHRSGDYLIMLKGKISWTKSINFIIMPSKQYFERFAKSDIGNISCYYLNRDLANILIEQQAKIKPGEIEIQAFNNEKSNTLKEDLEIKIPFILTRISNEKNSDFDFIYEGNRYEEIQNKVSKLKFVYGSGLKQAIELNGNGKNLILDEEKKFAIKENSIYIDDTASKKDIAEAINYYLFNSSIIAEAIEIILYKSIETLNKEFDSTELESINKRWKPDYQKKWIEFQKEILGNYISDFSQVPADWYCYNHQVRSELLISIEREEGLLWFEERMNFAKANYDGYFDSFKLEIDNVNIDKIAELKNFLLKKDDADSYEFLNKIDNIRFKLGIEVNLDEIEKAIEEKYTDFSVLDDPHGVKIQKNKLKISDKVNEIFNKMSSQSKKEITNNILHTSDSTIEIIKANINKKILKTDSFGNRIEMDFESLGASGEIDVLNYYINEFIKLPSEERKKGIDQVYSLIENKLGGKDLMEYKIKCLESIENDLELQKALIPFFYVTLHFKYAYFDLIVYKEGKPTLVEVKTTRSERNNRFFFSIAEVNASRGSDEYEIVRVTDNSISFLGNPVKLVEDKISSIKADTFSLTPRNYEFNFINN